MARLAKDYQTYKSKLNVTFVGINTCMGNTEKRMRAQIEQFNLKPFAHVLDSTGSIAAAYGVRTRVPISLVVVDGDGKIAYYSELEDCLQKAKGVLAGLTVPAGAEQAAHMYSLQQFDQVEFEFAKIPQSAESRAFKEALKKKTEEYTKGRLPQLQAMADKDPLAAYYETLAFLKAFRTAKEAGAVQSLCSKLASNAVVRKENEAEGAYNQVVAPELAKATTGPVYEKKVKPLMDGYVQRYGATRFGEAMKAVHEVLQKSYR